MIVEEIERLKQREQAAAFEKCEAIVARGLVGLLPTAPGLTNHQRAQVTIFVRWCAANNVRYCPAQPTTVAAFILGQKSIGVDPETVLDQVIAIEALHDHHGLSNPVATFPARSALAQIATLAASKLPRSWADNEKLLFPLLPIEIRSVIGRREDDREKTITRAFNECEILRKQLKDKEERNDYPQT